MLDTIQFTRF